jgi:iron complex outermembrane receptor protein
VSVWNEKLIQKTDNKSAIPDRIIGSAGSNDNGSRDVTSVFGEFNIPTTKTLELNLAGRIDKYSDFGTSFNPKISAKLKPIDQILLRASAGTGFKAPSLSQLYGASSEGYPQFIDRKACFANSAACDANQYLVTSGGNKDLKEEKALVGGFGIVIEPSDRFSTSLDLWYTKISNVVGIDFEEMTQAELKGINPADYGVTVTRDQNGIIESVNAPNLNLQEEEISGLDMNVNVVLAPNVLGHRLSLEQDLSYLLYYKREGFPGAGKRNVIGEWGYPGWRNSFNLNLKSDRVSYNLTARTIPAQNVVDLEIKEKIDNLTELDISIAYKLSKTSHLSAGIKNFLNTAAPADKNGGSGGAAVVNSDLYDINGRIAFVGYSQKF